MTTSGPGTIIPSAKDHYSDQATFERLLSNPLLRLAPGPETSKQRGVALSVYLPRSVAYLTTILIKYSTKGLHCDVPMTMSPTIAVTMGYSVVPEMPPIFADKK